MNEDTYAVELDNRTYGKGVIGAVLGVLVGAAVWAVVYKLGYMVGLVGLLIGFLACKGYDLLKGKQGKGKIVILVLAVIVGVLLGTAGGLFWQIADEMKEMEIPMEFFGDFLELLAQNDEFMKAVIGDAIKGLLFASICVISFIVAESKKVAAKKNPEE